MPEPFKNLFNPDLIRLMAEVLGRRAGFDRAAFEAHALDGLDQLEMMQRSEQIADALDIALPTGLPAASEHLTAALHPTVDWSISDMKSEQRGLAGWAVTPMAALIARRKEDDPALGLAALRDMTMRSSSEFAVRPFFRDHFDLTMTTAMEWGLDANLHVRRLASEGSRPRLPWGLRLSALVKDPDPLFPLLDRLKDDPEEYVRRSVANNLNDIAKDHADRVAALAADWLDGAGRDRTRLVRHACRSLFKQGHPATLAAFGYHPPEVEATLTLSSSQVAVGETLDLSLDLTPHRHGPLMIDYVIHMMRANGSLSAKVFKWTEVAGQAGQKQRLTKSHPYRKVTTRTDYPGRQMLSIQINGQTVAEAPFDLIVP